MNDEYQEDVNRLKERRDQLENSLRRVKVEIEEKKEQKRQIEDALNNIEGKFQYINILRAREREENIDEEVVPDGET